MEAFQSAAMLSVQKGADDDIENDLMKIREALIESYVAVLHGMNPDPEHKKPAIISQEEIDRHGQ